MLFALTVPKKIRIHNYRLRLAYNIVFLLMGTLVLFQIIYNKKWSQGVHMSNAISLSLSTQDVTNAAVFAQAFESAPSEKLCQTPGVYDYLWDGNLNYTGHACATICKMGVVSPECVIGMDAVHATSAEAFFATQVRRTYFDGSEPIEKLYWIPVENAYEFAFQYSFSVPTDLVRGLNNLYLGKGASGSSTTTSHTVILDHLGNVQRHFPPSADGIRVHVPELLEWAGKLDWISQQQEELGSNHLEGSDHPLGPVGRLTGTEVHIHLTCYVEGNVPSKLKVGENDGSVCTAQAYPLPPQWVWRRSMELRNGILTMSHYHGIKVSFHVALRMRILSFPAILALLAEAVVLMQLPSRLFRMIMLKCFGHYSRIYRGVLNEKFSLAQHIASSALHLLTTSVIFRQLADKSDGISLKQITNSVDRAFQDFEELSSSERKAYALFCFIVATDIRNNEFVAYSARANLKARARERCHKRVMTRLKEMQTEDNDLDAMVSHALSKRNSDVDESQKLLDMKSFLTATSLTEMVQLHDAVEMFDRDRRVGRLERLVLPGFFRDQLLKPSDFFSQQLRTMSQPFVSEPSKAHQTEEVEDKCDTDQFSVLNVQSKNFVTVAALDEQLLAIKTQLEANRLAIETQLETHQVWILRLVTEMLEKSAQQSTSQQHLLESTTGAVRWERKHNSSEKINVCDETTPTKAPVNLTWPVEWHPGNQEHHDCVLQGNRIKLGELQKGDNCSMEGSSWAMHHEASSLITGHKSSLAQTSDRWPGHSEQVQMQATQRTEGRNPHEPVQAIQKSGTVGECVDSQQSAKQTDLISCTWSAQKEKELAELKGIVSQCRHQLHLLQNTSQQVDENVAKCAQMCEANSQQLQTAFRMLEVS